MWLNWVFAGLIPGWNDIIADPASGKVSRSRLFAAIGFFAAITLCVVSGIGDARAGRRQDPLTVGLLLANGLGLTALTGYFSQQNRKTVDPETGSELKPNPPEVDPNKLPG